MRLLAFACLLGLLAATSCRTGVTPADSRELIVIGGEIAASNTNDPDRADRIRRGADAAGRGTEAVLQAALPVTLEQEEAIGEGVALTAFTRVGARKDNEALQRYVNLVGNAVARRSTRPEVTYRFAVIDSPEVNAFAGPGGYIFVTTGALSAMRNESELAGVLAHEIAHVTQKHMLQTMKRRELLNGLTESANALDGRFAEYTQTLELSQELLFDKGYEQTFEYEADDVGTRMAAAAGYDPRGLRDFLERLALQSSTGGWFTTHPPATSRVERIRRTLAEDESLAGIGGAVNAERFQAAVAPTPAATP